MTVAAVLLIPILVHADTMRLASTTEVTWIQDGHTLGQSNGTAPLLVDLEAGHHELWAIGPDDQEWQVLARPEPAGPGVTYVEAWTARYEPPPEPRTSIAWAPAAILAMAAVLWLWPSKNP
ncbi:MAG: hypothetical protein ACPHID_01455 [Thermoplasmatota archaeon]